MNPESHTWSRHISWCVCCLLSRVQLFTTSWTVARQAPLSMGFSRQEYWRGLPFHSSGDLPDPGIEFRSPALQANSLPSVPPGSPISWLEHQDANFYKFLEAGCGLLRKSWEPWTSQRGLNIVMAFTIWLSWCRSKKDLPCLWPEWVGRPTNKIDQELSLQLRLIAEVDPCVKYRFYLFFLAP